jgi:hypothetical protein
VTPEEELLVGVRQAVNDSEGAAGNPDDLLTLQARAAVGAVIRLGWVWQAGWEYAAKRGDVTLSCGFHTYEGALQDAEAKYPEPWVIERRPIGVWEEVPYPFEEVS